jgi:hypothetical protein
MVRRSCPKTGKPHFLVLSPASFSNTPYQQADLWSRVIETQRKRKDADDSKTKAKKRKVKGYLPTSPYYADGTHKERKEHHPSLYHRGLRKEFNTDKSQNYETVVRKPHIRPPHIRPPTTTTPTLPLPTNDEGATQPEDDLPPTQTDADNLPISQTDTNMSEGVENGNDGGLIHDGHFSGEDETDNDGSHFSEGGENDNDGGHFSGEDETDNTGGDISAVTGHESEHTESSSSDSETPELASTAWKNAFRGKCSQKLRTVDSVIECIAEQVTPPRGYETWTVRQAKAAKTLLNRFKKECRGQVTEETSRSLESKYASLYDLVLAATQAMESEVSG